MVAAEEPRRRAPHGRPPLGPRGECFTALEADVGRPGLFSFETVKVGRAFGRRHRPLLSLPARNGGRCATP